MGPGAEAKDSADADAAMWKKEKRMNDACKIDGLNARIFWVR